MILASEPNSWEQYHDVFSDTEAIGHGDKKLKDGWVR